MQLCHVLSEVIPTEFNRACVQKHLLRAAMLGALPKVLKIDIFRLETHDNRFFCLGEMSGRESAVCLWYGVSNIQPVAFA